MTSNPIDPAVFDRMEARGDTGDGELGPEGVGPGPDGLLGPEGCYPPCQHLRLKPNLSATTSVMAITTNLWGVTCEDCGAKWDIGQVLQAIPDLAAAQATIAGLREFDVDTLRVCAETIYGKHQDLRLASVRQARNNFLQRLANALERLR
jgi:hypothetical protein